MDADRLRAGKAGGEGKRSGRNHRDQPHDDLYRRVYVDSAWGGNIGSVSDGGGGGSGNTCCVLLPYRYRPGLTAKILWNHTESRIDNWKETVASILPYPDGGGQAFVNFLPDDRVVILVGNMPNASRGYVGEHRAPSHPDYRGAEVEFPKEGANQ